MKILLFLLTAFCALAQEGIKNPAWLASATKAAAGGGGGTVSGPPGVALIATNSTHEVSGTNVSVTVTVSGLSNVLMWFSSFYSATEFIPGWKGSSNGVTLLTNAWFEATAKMVVYYLANPSSGSGTAAIGYDGTTALADLFVVLLTNWSGFQSGPTNYYASASYFSNRVTSAANHLSIAYAGVNDSVYSVTPGGGQTLIGTNFPGSGDFEDMLATKTGQADYSSNSITFGTSGKASLILFGAKGF